MDMNTINEMSMNILGVILLFASIVIIFNYIDRKSNK